ncbi:Planctomycete cytochrome C [Novipirellula aureliae]|uniref:Planctomycete cytochrome C n=1 Tax=Novipirellula aureliae TaxID=2527966 RepID=A0A5C6DJT3_9BACT|nr:c-type cytochrome domain-containing protein [Novipirellula aureliae]TWU37643.1 Planctomycete cytochrome C [Novipirellula aureliae]
MQRLRPLIVCFLCFLAIFANKSSAVELTIQEKQAVAEIKRSLSTAGSRYKAGQLQAAVESMKIAGEQMHEAVKKGSPAVYEELKPLMKSLGAAHVYLELEGVRVPPFELPRRDRESDQTSVSVNESNRAAPASNPPTPTPPITPSITPPMPASPEVGFVSDVVPILVNQCGRCHVAGSRGNFNMATYSQLMKGSRAGRVVFAGDVASSVLIDNIESGAMPPNGTVPASDLEKLKQWIASGAKFDGDDPETSLFALLSSASKKIEPSASAPINPATPANKQTVDFALQVAPMFIQSCSGCHLDSMQNRGGLRMDTFAQMMRGGDSGPIIVPGDAASSLLIQKLRGMAGDRMPAGGRPAFSDEAIELISTWINEGAVLGGDRNRANQPIKRMSQLAWADKATPLQLSDQRKQAALEDLQWVNSKNSNPIQLETDHFFVTGTADKKTIELVAEQAEEKMDLVRRLVPGEEGPAYFAGRATLFVWARRYDYSEFAKMIEARDVPADWNSHWKYDGLDAYVAIVATQQEESKEIAERLTGPLVSLALATSGKDVPIWFATGVGETIRKQNRQRVDRDTLRREQAELQLAAAAMKDAKQFLDEKLKPEQTDQISAAVVASMTERPRRKGFDSLLRKLGQGEPFEQAFQSSFGVTVEVYLTAWLGSR